MKLLSLETSGTTASFAALELDSQNQITRSATREINQSRQLSQGIMLEVAAVLEEAAFTLTDLDAIAVGLGPGSWTGLRIGLTTAKTLAQTRNIPLLGIPSLDAVAEATSKPQGAKICFVAVAPCRTGEVYAKLWLIQDGLQIVTHLESIVTSAALAEMVRDQAQDDHTIIVSGPPAQKSSLEVQQFLLTQNLPCTHQPLPDPYLAVPLARLAAGRLQDGERDDPLSLSPLYLAPSSAERVLAEKLARQNAG